MAKNMVLTYLHQLDPEIPMEYICPFLFVWKDEAICWLNPPPLVVG